MKIDTLINEKCKVEAAIIIARTKKTFLEEFEARQEAKAETARYYEMQEKKENQRARARQRDRLLKETFGRGLGSCCSATGKNKKRGPT